MIMEEWFIEQDLIKRDSLYLTENFDIFYTA